MGSATLRRLCAVLSFVTVALAASALPTQPGHEAEVRAKSEDPPRPEVLLDEAGASELFGGRAAKRVILHAGPQLAGTKGHQGALWLIDFSRDPVEPVLVHEDAHTWIGDPAISPDGTRVVYHDGSDIYVCRLEAGGGDAARIGPGFDPRWWIHPQTGAEYIIYVSTRWENSADVRGKTYIQRIAPGETRAVGELRMLDSKLALRGGRSRDGRYMSTSQPGWLWAELHPTETWDAVIGVIESRGGGHCNVSMSQDAAHPDRFLWLDGPHQKLFYDPTTDASIPPLAPYREFTYTEWSTHGNFLTASFYGAGVREFEPQNHVVGVYDWERAAWTPAARGAAAHHLWVRETPAEAMNAAEDVLRSEARFWEEHTPTPPPAWPANTEGLIFAWENAHAAPRLLDTEGNDASPVGIELTPHGRVRYARNGAMLLEGGVFTVDGIGDVVREAFAASGELTVALRVRADRDVGPTSAPFFYLGPSRAGADPRRAIMLAQAGQEVAWSATFGRRVESQTLDDSPLSLGKPTVVWLHVLAGGHSAAVGGAGIHAGAFSGGPTPDVDPAHMIFGSPGWRGAIDAVAIYDHWPGFWASEWAHAAGTLSRPRVATSQVTALLRRAPPLPDPSQSAYKRAWAAFEYDVEQVHSGDVPLGRILVARYVWMGGEKLPAAHAQSGDRHELHLEPYEANSQIHSERQFHLDDVDFDMPMFYDVGPLTED